MAPAQTQNWTVHRQWRNAMPQVVLGGTRATLRCGLRGGSGLALVQVTQHFVDHTHTRSPLKFFTRRVADESPNQRRHHGNV